ncbi:Dolichyl-phosphate-mannose--protein mannosyltransferase 4 [Mucor velutinosus]|uniref:Dolichyl-phosphate-mannose--protein mannosyltransferase 4 n=1 Tax=Mucor velutinosus TaxID=708070 RepID=A0AAN7D6Y6_9FUNG|nr:Dolichyl-phosphate-mannose--protein mannosyltransferase 4 [Mucor velutinosus]
MFQPTSPPPPVPSHQYQPAAAAVPKRHSDTLSLDFDSTTSDDESETLEPSYQKYKTEEHKFWQVHSSTTIISPLMAASDYAAISMSYVNPKLAKKQQQPQKKQVALSLAAQVQRILGSTFDEIDDEIENEWQSSRTKLNQTLVHVPSISLTMTS